MHNQIANTFCEHQTHKKRVIQMGEENNVINIGYLSYETLRKTNLFQRCT